MFGFGERLGDLGGKLRRTHPLRALAQDQDPPSRLGDVLRMVVFEGMKPTLLGVAIGAGGALALGRLLSGLIYGVKPTDPLTFVAVAFLLTGIALGASIIPAYRATKVDPLVALRYE